MTFKKRKKGERIPRREWEWNKTDTGCDGVHTYEGCLVWYHFSGNPHADQAGTNQSFEDFLTNGPKVDGAPQLVTTELRAMLLQYFESS